MTIFKLKAASSESTDQFKEPSATWPVGPVVPTAMPEQAAVADVFAGLLNIDEGTDNDEFFLRAEMPGINPDNDVEITAFDDVVYTGAGRQQEETTDDKDAFRSEFRYSSFSRLLPRRSGAIGADMSASHKDTVREVRVPRPESQSATRVPIATS